jgi:hypothetical protein
MRRSPDAETVAAPKDGLSTQSRGVVKMPYTDLTAAAAAQHRSDLLAGAAAVRREHRTATDGHRSGRGHHVRPFTAWRNWLEAGRL